MKVGANKGRKVAVIGAGIAGLTAALGFAQKGTKVSVFEAATTLQNYGAGLQITPNGIRALYALGLREALDLVSVKAEAVQPMDALSGRMITRFDLRRQKPPYLFLYRADLVRLLADACIDQGVEIAFDQTVDNIDPAGCVDGMPYDLIIGADGVKSKSRAKVGPQTPTFFTKQVAWRTVVPNFAAPPVARIWMAPHRHVVTYPMRDGALNVVAIQERDHWAEEGWNHLDDPKNLHAAFDDICPDLQGILQQAQVVRLWGLFRHDVVSHWYKDKLALIGDAAHPTLPFLAQGANLAIEDAYLLSASCDLGAVDAGLARYQNMRDARVRRAIAAANQNARNYHLSGMQRRIAHQGLRVLGQIAPDRFINRLSWLYEYDVTGSNLRTD